jgi:plastocyanin
MRTLFLVSLLIIVAEVLFAGCTQSQQPQPAATPATPVQPTILPPTSPVNTTLSQSSVSDNTITIKNFAFNPPTITVAAGSIVRWENRDPVPHRIMFTDKTESGSDALSPSQSYSKKFDRAGRFSYYCTIHPDMTGTIIVE